VNGERPAEGPVKVTVIDRTGGSHPLAATAGRSLMETIRDAGVGDILALCGGCASCATCHVYVDGAWSERVGEPAGDEVDLLESSDHQRPGSRLSCQIQVTPQLDGLVVTVAPED
jgi:ferredoxin, 2Fe-2S